MSHARAQILAAFESALTVQTFRHRVFALPPSGTAVCAVSWATEAVERVHVSGTKEQERTLQVSLTLVASDTDDPASIVEAAAVTAEQELAGLTIGDKVFLTDCSLDNEQGERPVANLNMVYSVTYRVNPDEPETIL